MSSSSAESTLRPLSEVTETPERGARQAHDRAARPFLKWAGGKGRLLDELLRRMPLRYGRYLEPFVGAGALFFALQPREAYLSDINDELITTYRVVQSDLEGLVRLLKRHRHQEEYFYKLRDADRAPSFARWSDVRRAARLIYLNKTCFNGLYRVNAQGYFNVPFGAYRNPTILDEANLRACHHALQGAELACAPFEAVLLKAKAGDFVYFDPPYAPLSATSNFTSYTRGGFDAAAQLRLRDVCRALDEKGVRWMLSNSSAPMILELYRDFRIEYVHAPRAINSVASKRGGVSELIIRNYDT